MLTSCSMWHFLVFLSQESWIKIHAWVKAPSRCRTVSHFEGHTNKWWDSTFAPPPKASPVQCCWLQTNATKTDTPKTCCMLSMQIHILWRALSLSLLSNSSSFFKSLSFSSEAYPKHSLSLTLYNKCKLHTLLSLPLQAHHRLLSAYNVDLCVSCVCLQQ